MLTPNWQLALSILNVLPLPGLGATIAGWRNAHTDLRRNGLLQMTLAVFGSWPLIVPGVLGFIWAIRDAIRMGGAKRIPKPPKNAAPPPD